jgi:hypothetical protein
MERSIFVRIPIEERTPTVNGNYLVTLEYPDGRFIVKKAFFMGGRFILKDGKKFCKVVNWFYRIPIEENEYQALMEKIF